MKKNISELNLNPINPRKIDDASFQRLLISVLLFQKMLELRDIIINKDDVVLAGNQRLKVLRKIENMGREDMDNVLQSSSRYANMSDKEKKETLDYWEEWKKNPVADVTVAENLTEEEEKELLIKDNKEFGVFDMDALRGIYDDNTLSEFGIEVPIADVSIFDNVSQESTENNEQSQESTENNEQLYYEILRFGAFRVPITEHEYSNLYRRWNEFTEETGGYEGFITHLIETKNNA